MAPAPRPLPWRWSEWAVLELGLGMRTRRSPGSRATLQSSLSNLSAVPSPRLCQARWASRGLPGDP